MAREKAKKTILENGIRVVTKPMPHVRSVSVGIWVDVGARDESEDQAGACHFIEHMIFKGTRTRSAYQIARELDAIGGHSNAFTAMEHTCYHGKVLDKAGETLVGLLADIFLNSVFDPAEIAREKDVVLQEIHMLEDTPEDYLHLLTQTAFFGNHPLGRSILGSPETLERFSTQILKTHISRWYLPEKIIIAAAGSVDHDRLVQLVAPDFGRLEQNSPPAVRQEPKTLANENICGKDLEQSHLCIACKGLCATDPDRYAYYVLNTLLGGNMSSRLFQEVREKRGLAYSVYSFLSCFVDSGMLGIYAAVEPDQTPKTLAVIAKQLQRLREEAPAPKDLESAKQFIKGSLFLSAESTDSQMLRLMQNEVFFGRHVSLDEVAQRVDSVTAKEVQELAWKILDPATTALAILGPNQTETGLQGILKG
jgi:predicted Zn-dependent peptidase